jgi:vacuolar protein sorting-associated protein IST1
MPLFGGYKATKLKPQLKMAVTRFTIASNKKSALMKQQIREIAKLLAEDPPKEEKARIKAEALIRDDNTVEAYEILQLNCELLAERINLITQSKDCPADMLSTVSTVIWASTIVDIPELIEIRKQFRYKYGKEFDEDCMQNVGGILNERVTSKLSVQPPSAYLVQTYLEKISDEHEVGWKPTVSLKAEEIAQPMAAPTGYSVQEGAASGLNKKELVTATAGGGISNSASVLPVLLPPKAPSSSAYVPAGPIESTAAATNSNTVKVEDDDSDNDDIEEVDIYVPAAPKSQPHSNNNNRNQNEMSSNRGRTQSAGEGSKGNDDEDGNDNDDDENNNTGGQGGDDSYEDLARRFAMLSK